MTAAVWRPPGSSTVSYPVLGIESAGYARLAMGVCRVVDIVEVVYEAPDGSRGRVFAHTKDIEVRP